MIPRAARTSSDLQVRSAPCPDRPVPRGFGPAAALLAVLALLTAAGAQELTFPGGVIWQIRLVPSPSQLPAFDLDNVYLVLGDGTVRAIDHATGTTRGTAPAESSVRPVSSGRHLAGAVGTTAWAIDARTGQPAWRADVGAAVAAPPETCLAGALFLTAGGDLALLKWEDGREAWRLRLPGTVSAPVAAGRDLVWVGFDDGRVLAIAIADGATAWVRALRARVLGLTPAEDRLFVGASDNFLYALKARDGGVAWRWRTGGDVVGPVTADARRVYFASLDAMLRAVDRRGGDLRWQRPLPTRAVGGPALAGTALIIAGVSPELRAYRTGDGGLAASAALPGRPLHGPYLAPASASAPVRLVVLTAGGYLLAVGQTLEPMLVPFDVLPGRRLPPEVLPEIKR